MSIIKKRLLLNGVLFLLVIALFWFVSLQMNRVKAVDSLYDKAMGDDIVSVRVDRRDQFNQRVSIEIKKIETQWIMMKPKKRVVEPKKMQHLFTLLAEPIDARYPVKDRDLSVFGLDNNQLSVFFNGVKIQFGSINPITQKRYLRKKDTIYLVSETVYGLLNRGVAGFVQKSSN
ncbi:MAG: DUF4340 domain-containing protein [Cocleimonas sp.]|nr:DUF4340 domain-containing protein [Cocleimonas sp.]